MTYPRHGSSVIGPTLVFSTVLFAAAGCNDPAASDPQFVGDWALAQPRTMPAKTTQTECSPRSATSPIAATISAIQPPPPAELLMTLQDANFRCQQTVCGYVQDFGDLLRVLVQPCDLNPKIVPKCDCTYDVTVTFPARPLLPNVRFFVRRDFYGATDDNPPVLVGDTKATSAN
ncbi:MAG: hypothetical protein H7X95_09265 [Deltaproteobacteria bacterium]|nr:hypothetical protein [Deltaproteobacteria bacterium]